MVLSPLGFASLVGEGAHVAGFPRAAAAVTSPPSHVLPLALCCCCCPSSVALGLHKNSTAAVGSRNTFRVQMITTTIFSGFFFQPLQYIRVCFFLYSPSLGARIHFLSCQARGSHLRPRAGWVGAQQSSQLAQTACEKVVFYRITRYCRLYYCVMYFEGHPAKLINLELYHIIYMKCVTTDWSCVCIFVHGSCRCCSGGLVCIAVPRTATFCTSPGTGIK